MAHTIKRAWPATPSERELWQKMDEAMRAMAEQAVAEAAPGDEVFAICGDVSCFPDDVIDHCSRCLTPLTRRPWHDATRVTFVCFACVALDGAIVSAPPRLLERKPS